MNLIKVTPLSVIVAFMAVSLIAFSGAGTAYAANPCAANPCAANPCAANPCAANPCAANPCAANPCAANPCNPCAGGDAAELTDAQAAAAYKRTGANMRAGYAKSKDPTAAVYFTWKRYNKVPYVSETHGGRHVNNFANSIAKDYGKYEKAGVMPVGSVLAKDSFKPVAGAANPCAANPCAANPCAANPCAANPCAANPCAANPCAANPCAANPCAANPCAAGAVNLKPGPLFIMEKMSQGFYPASGDWRYTMIMPDGSIWGQTKGKNSANMQFCIDCHETVAEEQDHLFFMPDEYRM